MTIERRPMPSETEAEREMYGRLLRDVRRAQAASWVDAMIVIAENAAKALFWILAATAMIWLGLMALDRSDPITGNTRELLSRYAHHGEGVMTRRTRKRLRECEVKHQEVIVDAAGQHFTFEPKSYVSFGPPEDRPVTDIGGPRVPYGAAPGEAETFSIVGFYCNALQRAMDWPIVRVTPRSKFKILKDDQPYPKDFTPPPEQLAGGTSYAPPVNRNWPNATPWPPQ